MAHKIIASWLAREALVVEDGAAVLADPGECPLHDPAAGQHLERVRVAPDDDLQGYLHAGGPGGELAGIDGIGPDQADARQARCRFHSGGRAASRSGTDAAVITSASSRPSASTAMCRLRPFTFFA